MKKDYCGNCLYFNGETGDNKQFCDEKEIEVHEESYCYRHKEKWKDKKEHK